MHHTAIMGYMRIRQLISIDVVDAIATSHGPQVTQHTRSPDTSGWWVCCGCDREVNPSLYGEDCPDCGHTKCSDCGT